MNLRTLLAAGAFAFLPFSAYAEECQFPYNETLHQFATSGAPWEVITDDVLPNFEKLGEAVLGKDLTVTRGFVVVAGGKVLVALEVDGCLLPPISIGSAEEKQPRLSGRDKNGNTGA